MDLETLCELGAMGTRGTVTAISLVVQPGRECCEAGGTAVDIVIPRDDPFQVWVALPEL